MIDILMTTYFRKDFTKKVIDHIIERTKTPFQFIIVDNGSSDGTREMLQEYQKSHKNLFKKIILLSKNAGLQAAKNIGMDHVTTERFVNTDNDCLCPDLDPDWLTQMNDLMDRNPEFAAISLRPQIMIGVGNIFRDAAEVVQNNVAGGSFRLMKTDLVREAGQWRDDFENRQEEWHICTKLRDMGHKVGYARDLFCYHMFGENENWGYPTEVEHYHNKANAYLARDVEYDPKTCVPKVRHNE